MNYTRYVMAQSKQVLSTIFVKLIMYDASYQLPVHDAALLISMSVFLLKKIHSFITFYQFIFAF